MNSDLAQTLELKKIDHIKDLLSKQPQDRTEKDLLELMSFTRVFIFKNRSLSSLKILP